jgi:hypothetical protein
MSEMIERIAKAMVGHVARNTYQAATAWEDGTEEAREEVRAVARLVIEEMREPTKAMTAAGISCECVEHTWQAMIDEALK